MSEQFREFCEILRERLELAPPVQTSTLGGFPKQRGDAEFSALQNALEIDAPRLELYTAALNRMKYLQVRFTEIQAERQEAERECRSHDVSARLNRIEESIAALATYDAAGGDVGSPLERLRLERDSLALAQSKFTARMEAIVAECNSKVTPITAEMAYIRTTCPALFGTDAVDLLLPLGREPRTAFEAALCACC